MKLSVSITDDDVRFVEEQLESGAFSSRSAVIQAGLRLLRDREHVDSYAAAWDEWDGSDDSALWNSATDDGLRS